MNDSIIIKEPLADRPYFRLRWPNGKVDFFEITKDTFLLGRGLDSDLIFPESFPYISRRQSMIHRSSTGYAIEDLESTNGTYINSTLIEPGKLVPLNDKAIIRIGDEKLGASVGITFFNPTSKLPPVDGFATASIFSTLLTQVQQISIGRSPDCEIQLDSPDVSRKHAQISRINELYLLEDLGSLNGTFLNGQQIKKTELKDGDFIQIAKYILLFKDGELAQYQSQGTRLDVLNLSKDINTRHGQIHILEEISMTVLPGEFIGLVGGSGAGKTTLLNALIGLQPGKGDILLNGNNLYNEREHFRALVGYVPQSDILHTSLTVEKALDYSARLRLPGDVSTEDRQGRITTVLETVSMNTEILRKTRVGDLSGGQRKRVSIAAELLADPQLIYLDEATSGLDPGLEKRMMFTLRRMADEGRTVVLITHATANIIQTDYVAFLSEGKLVFFGPSQESLDFFGVEDFADIYDRIEEKGEQWNKAFWEEDSHYAQKYILDRQKIPFFEDTDQAIQRKFGLRDYIRQFAVLTQRTLSVLMSDKITLLLMLMLFPLTATLQLVISTPEILTGNLTILADPVAAARTLLVRYLPLPKLNTFVFVMGLEAVLVGMYVPSTELIRERAIYLRERMVNLKVIPYLLSKVVVFTLLAAIQTGLYLLVLSIRVNIPTQGLYLPGPMELFVTLFLTMVAGMGIGFIVSAVSRSTDMAIYMLVMLMFFQFFFAGTVFDLRGNRAEAISYATTTRWALTAIGVTIDMPKIAESTILCNEAPDNPLTPENDPKTVCFNYPETRDDLMLPYEDSRLIQAWIVLALMTVACMAITGLLIKRLDRV